MSDLTPKRLDQIEQAAKAASEHDRMGHLEWMTADDFDLYAPEIAEHIANMDPAATLALIARVRELEAQIAAAQAIIGPRENLDPNQGGCEGWADETLLAILDALGDEV